MTAVDEREVIKFNLTVDLIHFFCFVGVCNLRLFLEDFLDSPDRSSTLGNILTESPQANIGQTSMLIYWLKATKRPNVISPDQCEITAIN